MSNAIAHFRRRMIAFKLAAVKSIAPRLIRASLFSARRYLRSQGARKILVDNSVLGHAITHETAWISTGTKKWGPHDIETGYAARIPVHSPHNDTRLYREICFLPGIALLAKERLLNLYTSAELGAERFRQPAGRFCGYGFYDLNLFSGVQLETLDGFHFDSENPEEAQQYRLCAVVDEPYVTLVRILGKKNNLDAWHIHTAELHNMSCFLTLDFRLRDAVERARNHKDFPRLTCEVLTPSELGRQLRLLPVPTNILSYERASYPVHPEFSWPNERRNRPRGDS